MNQSEAGDKNKKNKKNDKRKHDSSSEDPDEKEDNIVQRTMHLGDRAETLFGEAKDVRTVDEAKALYKAFRSSVKKEGAKISRRLKKLLPESLKHCRVYIDTADWTICVNVPGGWILVSHGPEEEEQQEGRVQAVYRCHPLFYKAFAEYHEDAKLLEERLNHSDPSAVKLKDLIRQFHVLVNHPCMLRD